MAFLVSALQSLDEKNLDAHPVLFPQKKDNTSTASSKSADSANSLEGINNNVTPNILEIDSGVDPNCGMTPVEGSPSAIVIAAEPSSSASSTSCEFLPGLRKLMGSCEKTVFHLK